MTDREKVINGLEWCMNERHDCYREKGCPYENVGDDVGCKYALHRDAIDLLKAHKPCEDWISRKRLKDEIQYYIDEAGWSEEINKALGWCLEFIDNQRAVKRE